MSNYDQNAANDAGYAAGAVRESPFPCYFPKSTKNSSTDK